jgi:hypothetical protein
LNPTETRFTQYNIMRLVAGQWFSLVKEVEDGKGISNILYIMLIKIYYLNMTYYRHFLLKCMWCAFCNVNCIEEKTTDLSQVTIQTISHNVVSLKMGRYVYYNIGCQNL